ncbi:hypothetical protein D9M70_552250 [compost metagenome]
MAGCKPPPPRGLGRTGYALGSYWGSTSRDSQRPLTLTTCTEGIATCSRVEQALSELPGDTRQAYLRLVRERQSAEKIAEGMGIPRAAVEQHVIAALKHLRRRTRNDEGQ